MVFSLNLVNNIDQFKDRTTVQTLVTDSGGSRNSDHILVTEPVAFSSSLITNINQF